MFNRVLKSCSNVAHVRPPPDGEPAFAAFAGYFGYIFWVQKQRRQNLKRRREISEEFEHRAQLVIQGNEKLYRRLYEPEDKKANEGT